MLICKTCRKVIANTNPTIHYGICAACPDDFVKEHFTVCTIPNREETNKENKKQKGEK